MLLFECSRILYGTIDGKTVTLFIVPWNNKIIGSSWKGSLSKERKCVWFHLSLIMLLAHLLRWLLTKEGLVNNAFMFWLEERQYYLWVCEHLRNQLPIRLKNWITLNCTRRRLLNYLDENMTKAPKESKGFFIKPPSEVRGLFYILHFCIIFDPEI